jgi:hypothetical protein
MFFRIGINSSHLFPALFRKFDEEKFNLGIDSYGVSVTTLEEVFLKIGHGEAASNEDKQVNEVPAEDFEMKNETNEPKGDKSSLENGSAINEIMKKSGDVEKSNLFSDWFRHFLALFVKRYHVLKRDKSTILCLILVPTVLMLIGVFAIWTIAAQRNQNLSLDFSQYRTPVPIPMAKSKPPSDFVNSFSDLFPSTASSVSWDSEVFNATSLVSYPRYSFDAMYAANISKASLLPRASLAQEILRKSAFWTNPSYGGFVDVANNGSFPFEFWIYLNQTGVHGKRKFISKICTQSFASL